MPPNVGIMLWDNILHDMCSTFLRIENRKREAMVVLVFYEPARMPADATVDFI